MIKNFIKSHYVFSYIQNENTLKRWEGYDANINQYVAILM